MSLQVLGAGFGRTGTASLKQALETLGFGPCYHMYEIEQKPERAEAFLQAALGQPVDWNKVFEGYQSAVDWPAVYFLPELLAQSPESRVILTTRDAESWYQSTTETIYTLSQLFPKWLTLISKKASTMKAMIDTVIWQKTFNGRFGNRAEAVAVYKAHIANIQRLVPEDRLLMFNVADGWEPLCNFLGVGVPDTPFPKTNETAEMKQRIRLLKGINLGFYALVLLLVVGLGLLLFR